MIAGGVKALMDLLAGGAFGNSSFREIMDALPVAVYTTDSEGRLTYYNDAAVKLSGSVPQIGTDQWCVTWKLFLADGTPLPYHECPMAIALRGGQVPGGIECIAERPDGTRFWFTPCPAALRDLEGRIIGGINILVDITDRKKEELEAKEQFRAIVETTPECVKIVSFDGTVRLMNSAGLAMVGATFPGEVVGKNIYDLLASEDRQKFREFNEHVCQGGKGSLDFDIIGLHGKRCHMETHSAPLRDSGGNTFHLGITRDVTKRKQAERAALLSAEIVRSSDDAIISKDLEGVITSWNVGAERLFGYTANEVIGKSVTLLIPPDRLEEEPQILRRLKRGERIEQFETVRRRKDGELLDISLTISPVKDARGNIIGASKIARDITERKRAQAVLQASEARFRQLADSMPQIVWTARPDGHLDYYNERWYRFSGFSPDYAGRQDWKELIHPEDMERCREVWATSFREGKPFKIEHRLWDRDAKSWRWFMAQAVPIRDAKKNIIKWFGSSIDVDEQKRIEQDLRSANQNLEQFSYSASHDLQEPLRSVKIYSELLSSSFGDQLNEQGREFLARVHSGASQMEILVRDLLAYTQVVNFDRPAQNVDASAALSASLENLSGAIAESGAQISAGPLPSVQVHEGHLRQLFQNLIGNAIKYRRHGLTPHVHVSAERVSASWIFCVSDNGIGIEPQYKESIFGLFKRLHTSQEYSGTGIGLAICQRIVERYGGQIWVESELGHGSIFRFRLPAQERKSS